MPRSDLRSLQVYHNIDKTMDTMKKYPYRYEIHKEYDQRPLSYRLA